MFAIYIVLSGLTRFLVEFVRANPPILLGLTEAQWTSVALGAVQRYGSGNTALDQ